MRTEKPVGGGDVNSVPAQTTEEAKQTDPWGGQRIWPALYSPLVCSVLSSIMQQVGDLVSREA